MIKTTNCASLARRSCWAVLVLCAAMLASCQDGPIDPAPPIPPDPNDTLWTFDKFIAEAETLEVTARPALVDSFVNYWRPLGIPPTDLPRDSAFGSAAFLFQSSVSSASVAGDFNGWNPSADVLTRLNGTTLFYKEFRFERNARFDYKFVLPGNNWVLDPLNARTFPGGFGPNSQMWMPDFTPPPEAQNDTGIAHGTQETFSITSNILGNTRTVTVYLPPAFGDTLRSYPVLYCHDGNDYRNFLRIMTIADNMIAAQRVPPFMIVMVPPVNRSGEYHMNPLFARFFTEELIPRIDSVYATLPTRAGRLIIGDSSGGLGALYLAWHKSDYFQYCIPQSGYFSWNGDALIDSINANPARDIRIYMNVGTYETLVGGDENLQAAQQRLEQVLIAKGYAHQAVYLPDGHSWANWQRVMPDALEWIWGE